MANIHAQAAGVQNIWALVPVVLDLTSPHYNKWRDLVLLTLGRYSLADHVTSDAAFPDDPAWHRMDCVVLSWIYGTVSPELMEVVRVRGNTARTAWLDIEHQFLSNCETRVYLDAEFRTFMQGDLSVTDYCRKMKSMADALADLGEYIPNHTLVLNVLRGLSGKFTYMTPHFKRQRPFPTFNEVRADLLLEELMGSTTSSTSSTALVATTPGDAKGAGGPGGPSAPKGASSGSSTQPGSGSGYGRRRRRGSGNGGGKNADQSTTGQSAAPWPSFYNPWTGTIQMWPGPPAAPSGSQPRARSPVLAGAGIQPPHALVVAAPGPYGYPLVPQQQLELPPPARAAPARPAAPVALTMDALVWGFLGSAGTCQCVQHHVPQLPLYQRVGYGLRSFLAYDARHR